jgi:hypothetical protein
VKLRFITDEPGYHVGQIIDPEWPIAQLYLERKVCERVEEGLPDAPPKDKAIKPRNVKRK